MSEELAQERQVKATERTTAAPSAAFRARLAVAPLGRHRHRSSTRNLLPFWQRAPLHCSRRWSSSPTVCARARVTLRASRHQIAP